MTICSIDDCDKPSETRGWCHAHYVKWWRDNSTTGCSMDGCTNSVRTGGRGWCNKHYARWRRHDDVEFGDPDFCGVTGCQERTASERRVTFRVPGWPEALNAYLSLCWDHSAMARRQADAVEVAS
jgi:hypothetical protein